MSKLIPGNQKHLTLNDRLYIEKAINEGRTFKDIAKNLCKDPTTISKEVKAHRLSVWKDHGLFVNMKNFCEHRYHCRKTNACGKIILSDLLFHAGKAIPGISDESLYPRSRTSCI